MARVQTCNLRFSKARICQQGIEHWRTGPFRQSKMANTCSRNHPFTPNSHRWEDRSSFVDSIYILKDRGRLTANRLTFASPLRELAFQLSRRSAAPRSGYSGKVVVNEPNFGHRKKGRPFFGWIIGIKFKPTWSGPLDTEIPMIVACQHSLKRAISGSPSCLTILDQFDQSLRAFSADPTRVNHEQ